MSGLSGLCALFGLSGMIGVSGVIALSRVSGVSGASGDPATTGTPKTTKKWNSGRDTFCARLMPPIALRASRARNAKFRYLALFALGDQPCSGSPARLGARNF